MVTNIRFIGNTEFAAAEHQKFKRSVACECSADPGDWGKSCLAIDGYCEKCRYYKPSKFSFEVLH